MNKIPNILSCFRIIIAPVLLFLAWKGYHNLFIVLLITSLLSDAVDGFIARKLDATTDLGAKLDSLGDMAVYLTVPVCAWWLWPEILKKEALFVFIAISAYVIPLAAGLIKFGKIPSYHTLGAKIAAVIMSIGVLILFITEFMWIFRLAVIFQVIVACEEVLITIQLSTLQSDVKSIWHVKKALL
ncbi:MAG: CDP-alcohol phosphatidyltransferase family protein [Desulfobacterales bacterium]|nr:CDP-alcohol phosphatidyltransferase family protein [Desulfobacterales bacterium]